MLNTDIYLGTVYNPFLRLLPSALATRLAMGNKSNCYMRVDDSRTFRR